MALMGGVGHEINNPLTIILGFLDLELLKGEVPEETKKRLTIMREEVLKVESLTNQLVRLAYSSQLPRVTLNLNNVIEQTTNEASALYPIKFTLELEEHLPDISFVPIQLSSIFWQLIQNAHEAFKRENNSNPRIIIKTFQKKKWIICQFQDNGPGVPQDIREHVFKPFVSASSNEQGIGLNLCYEWLKHHKAKIYLLKNTEKGSIFQLEFLNKT